MIAAPPVAAPPVSAAPAWPQLADVRPIALHSGVNTLPRFAPDGRTGLIVSAAPNTATASGAYTSYTVLLRRAPPDRGWSLARFASADDAHGASPWSDAIIDVPHTGEDQVKSVRFAHARVNGRAETVVLTAERDMAEAETVPDPAHVTFTVRRLVLDPAFAEETFEVVGRRRSRACFGNSDAALATELGLPLPPGFEGDAQPRSCPVAKP